MSWTLVALPPHSQLAAKRNSKVGKVEVVGIISLGLQQRVQGPGDPRWCDDLMIV